MEKKKIGERDGVESLRIEEMRQSRTQRLQSYRDLDTINNLSRSVVFDGRMQTPWTGGM